MEKKFKILIPIFIVLILGLASYFYLPKIFKVEEKDYQTYLEEGLHWKSLGDQTGNSEYYLKAEQVYRKMTEKFPDYWVPWWNLANLQRQLKEFEEAEKSFKKAIEIAPGEGNLYLGLIEFYQYDLKKSEEEILAIYQEALKRVVENIDVIISYASYLYQIDKKEEALKYYQTAFEKYPEATQIKEEIEKIKGELKK